MEVVKQIFAILGTGVGVLSGLVTLYAKYLDMKKKSAGAPAADDSPVPVVAEPRRRRLEIADGPSMLVGQVDQAQPDELDDPPLVLEVRQHLPATAAIRNLVRPPAIAMMVAGGLGLIFNLAVAGFGYVDEFVTPLSTETRARHEAETAHPMNPADESDRTSAMLGADHARWLCRRQRRRRMGRFQHVAAPQLLVVGGGERRRHARRLRVRLRGVPDRRLVAGDPVPAGSIRSISLTPARRSGRRGV